jgi:hypothetical protein
MTPSVNLRADGRYVRVHMEDQVDAGNVEATLGLGFTFGGGGLGTTMAEAQPVATPNQPPTVTCAVDRSEVKAVRTVNVTATRPILKAIRSRTSGARAAAASPPTAR